VRGKRDQILQVHGTRASSFKMRDKSLLGGLVVGGKGPAGKGISHIYTHTHTHTHTHSHTQTHIHSEGEGRKGEAEDVVKMGHIWDTPTQRDADTDKGGTHVRRTEDVVQTIERQREGGGGGLEAYYTERKIELAHYREKEGGRGREAEERERVQGVGGGRVWRQGVAGHLRVGGVGESGVGGWGGGGELRLEMIGHKPKGTRLVVGFHQQNVLPGLYKAVWVAGGGGGAGEEEGGGGGGGRNTPHTHTHTFTYKHHTGSKTARDMGGSDFTGNTAGN
jgi:hypothetical protein